MMLRKMFYGIRGTVFRSMTIICIPPLIITSAILYFFISDYSEKAAMLSLQKSTKYAAGAVQFTSDNESFYSLIRKNNASGGAFFFIIDEEGTLHVHPDLEGEKDPSLLEMVRADSFFSHESELAGGTLLTWAMHIPERKIYIGTSVDKSLSNILVREFTALLAGLVIVTPLIILMISFFIARSIRNPLKRIIEVAVLVGQGDLSKFIIQDHYRKCTDMKDCDRTDCPAYGSSNLACWGIEGTGCCSADDAADQNEKISKYCSKCSVYRNSIRGEYDELIDAVNNMIVATQNVVASIKEVSGELTFEAETLAETSRKVETEMQNQAGYIEETTSSNEELAASIDNIASAAQNQAENMTSAGMSIEKLSETSADVSRRATNVNQKTQQAVKDANETKTVLDNTTEKINQISVNSQKIVEIVQIINDISDQINLLSLNASIEAARAGDHGKGFAVVAEEISKLADATASSTKEIEAMIQQTRADVSEGAEMVNNTNNAIVQMVSTIKTTAKLIVEIADFSESQRKDNALILEDIEKINQMSEMIAGTTAEQKTNSNEILKALASINDSIQIITGSSESLHRSAEELKNRSEKLNSITDYFTV